MFNKIRRHIAIAVTILAIAMLASVSAPAQGGAVNQVRKLLESEMPLGMLCDIFSFALPLEEAFKQSLLEELSVSRRTASLAMSPRSLPPSPAWRAAPTSLPAPAIRTCAMRSLRVRRRGRQRAADCASSRKAAFRSPTTRSTAAAFILSSTMARSA